ncbi:unnamed protein product [Arctia plantaginis]|uniref:CRAL-TRIO domain-containing protein n=1 Tax=Arctia plantaginis TaxID=874455 RepID=A0A8S0YNX4_ARCPL|nr:unnamed protein product [Arctia plantaginis]
MSSDSVMLVQPHGELLAKIREDLHEVVSSRENDLAAIKDWLKKQPHLPDEMEDSFLLNFLRGCSFSMEKCKRKMDMYFTMRTACPEFFTNRDITRPELMDLMIRAQNPTLPGLTPGGRRITVCRGLDKNLETHQILDAFKIIMMVADVRLREETEGVAGHVFIFDASILLPSHILKISPTMIKKFLICLQEAYPLKVKEVHVVNASPLVDTIYNIVKPFIKEKIKNRIFFHKDYTGLHEYIPVDILPSEYGGTSSSLEEITRAWLVKLKEYRPWFKKQESLKANEALRPGKPTDYDELFGVNGSFRQLSID